ncbi:TPA: hypothetical protein ACH3X1_009172 [Trebouxia sp. C0004]
MKGRRAELCKAAEPSSEQQQSLALIRSRAELRTAAEPSSDTQQSRALSSETAEPSSAYGQSFSLLKPQLRTHHDGSSAYFKYYDKIQTILELPVPDEVRKEVYFRVRWYNRLLVSPDPKCTGVQLIKATGSQSDFDSQQPYILASNVEHDLFFASVPGSIAGSQPWLWVMHYESSATVMPDVLLSDNGEPVEIQ